MTAGAPTDAGRFVASPAALVVPKRRLVHGSDLWSRVGLAIERDDIEATTREAADEADPGHPKRRKTDLMRDIMGIMKQAQAMQEKMTSLQSELDTVEVSGASGGGTVAVTMTGKGLVRQVAIDPSLMIADEREILEDLIVAAVNDARAKAEAAAQERMAELTKGLPLPPGMKLPF